MRVVVAGATGTLGGHVVDLLVARGHEVVALGRNADVLADLKSKVAAVKRVDVTRREDVVGVAEGVDAVVSTVGLVGMKALFASQTHDSVDRQGNLHLVAEAARAGASTFAYASVQHADPSAEVEVLRAKGEVEVALRESPMDAVIARPTVYHDLVWQVIMRQAKLGLVVLPGDGRARLAPISARDVAGWLVGRLDGGARTEALGGPETFTYDEAAVLCFHLLDGTPRIAHAPLPLLRLASRATSPLRGAASAELDFLRFTSTHDLVAPPAGKMRLEDELRERLQG